MCYTVTLLSSYYYFFFHKFVMFKTAFLQAQGYGDIQLVIQRINHPINLILRPKPYSVVCRY